MRQLETSLAGWSLSRIDEQKQKIRICTVLPVPRLAPLISQYSILTQTTHQILVSQFKNRLPGTILPFPAVFGLHIGSLFQPLFPLVFRLSLPSSCPCCSVAEYLPVRKRIIPLFSLCRTAASKSAPVPAQLALAGSHPTDSPAQLVPRSPIRLFSYRYATLQGMAGKIRLSLLRNS